MSGTHAGAAPDGIKTAFQRRVGREQGVPTYGEHAEGCAFSGQ